MNKNMEKYIVKQIQINNIDLIDLTIKANVGNAIEQSKEELQEKEVNIFSKKQKQEMLKKMDMYMKEISTIFDLGFSKIEQEIIERKGIRHRGEKIKDESSVEGLLILKNINAKLDNMLKENCDNQTEVYILERKFFIEQLIRGNLLEDKEVQDLLQRRKMEKIEKSKKSEKDLQL